MDAFSKVGMGAMFLVSLVLGIRLLRLAAQTHKLPELIVGSSSLCNGVGCALMVVGGALFEESVSRGSAVLFGGLLVMSLSAGLLAVGSWRIFRPDSWVAAAATAALGILLAAFYLVLLFADHHGRPPMEHPSYLIGFAIRISPFVWLAFESLRYSGMLRRQVSLGLAEGFIAHQFLLWGLAGCSALITFTAFLSSVLLGRPLTDIPVALLAMGAFGLLSAVFMWTAFFPPARLRQRFESAVPSA